MKFSPIFQDGMVLQREKPILFFGTGSGHGKIAFRDQIKEFDSDGERWEVSFPACAAGGPYAVFAELDGEWVTLRNVMVGEVFLASGQSNMVLNINATGESVSCSESIRFFSSNPDQDRYEWYTPDPSNVGHCSAIAIHFAYMLTKEHNVPVGMITIAAGAASMEAWLPEEDLDGWECDVPREYKHGDSDYAWNAKGWLYENRLKFVFPFPLRGVLWYQGESNAFRYETYRFHLLLQKVINRWRKEFRDSELPFFTVQLAPYLYVSQTSNESTAARQGQLLASKMIPNVAIVPTGDIGEFANIHPVRKREVANRLFRAVEHHLFGRTDLEYTGPTFEKMEIVNGDAVITFSHAKGLMIEGDTVHGLMVSAEPPAESEPEVIYGHRGIAAPTRFWPAQGRVDGDKLIVHCQGITPAQVRFCSSNYARPNLFNADGFPALVFHCSADGLCMPLTTNIDW